VTYTQMLDSDGGIQCDLTVARTGAHEFRIITGTGFATHDFDWIERNIPADADAQLFDVTSATAVLALMGPASRDILGAVTDDELSNAAFPFGSVRSLSVAGCELDALRITYVGELGYELHVPVELAVTVYDAVMAAGRPHGLVNAGYRAIESCRLESRSIFCALHVQHGSGRWILAYLAEELPFVADDWDCHHARRWLV